MEKLNLDFVHIGYHKTASSWFQFYGYKNSSRIRLLNDVRSDFYRIFMNTFVLPDKYNFDYQEYFKSFWTPQLKIGDDPTTIKGICEENLSGHFWTGRNSDTLLQRVNDCFDSPKVIISIRQQDNMLASLYSNYIKNGGTLTAKRLLSDVCFEGNLVLSKLCYDRLISSAQEMFGFKNVMVYAYEEFQSDPMSLLWRIFQFIGAEEYGAADFNIRVNKGRGKIGLQLERILNVYGFHGRYSRKIIDYLTAIDLPVPKNSMKHLTVNFQEIWKESNNKTAFLTSIDLADYGYHT